VGHPLATLFFGILSILGQGPSVIGRTLDAL